MLRRQLPAYSPVSLRGLLAGMRGAFSRGAEERLRRRVLEHYGARDVLLVDSGTSALRLALEAATGERPGPVALPAYSCYDLATAADGADAEVVLYDVDPATLGPAWGTLSKAAQGAAAVVIVHLYGIPVDLDRARMVAGSAGAVLIEDAAQGTGGMYRGAPLGAHGSLAVLSFGRGKGMTGGGGGALLANDDVGTRLLATVRDLPGPGGSGWRPLLAVAAQWLLGRPAIYGLPSALPFLRLGETIYRSPTTVRGVCRAACAVLAAQWEAIQRENAARRATAGAFLARIEGVADWATVTVPSQGVPGYLRIPVRIRRPEARARALGAPGLGVMPGYPRPLASLDGFRGRCRNADESFPGAEQLSYNLFTFPAHRFVSAGDLARLVAVVAGSP